MEPLPKACVRSLVLPDSHSSQVVIKVLIYKNIELVSFW